jgi:hypothetical protein
MLDFAGPTKSQIAVAIRQFALAATRLQFGSSGDSNLGEKSCQSPRLIRRERIPTASHAAALAKQAADSAAITSGSSGR